MSNFTVVTVNYNSSEHTCSLIDNLESIIIESDFSIKLLIIDNNSKKENLGVLEDRIKNLKWANLYKNKDNVGYFRGLNVGLEMIPDAERDWVVICNNDLKFENNFFDCLLKITLPQDTFVIAPRITTIDGREQNPHVVKSISYFRRFCYDLYFLNYHLGRIMMKFAPLLRRQDSVGMQNFENREIYMGIGACYILTKEYFKKCNKLDERVFLWGEEALLAGQVKEAKGKTIFAPALRVYHSESASVSKIPSHESYLISRGSYKIYRRYLR